MHAVAGSIPEVAQKGLKDTLKLQGYFLACVCQPEDDMEIRQANVEGLRHRASVSAMERLNANVMRLRLRPNKSVDYQAGQFINLMHRDVTRSYSLASLPGDEELELHVRQVPGGKLSELAISDVSVCTCTPARAPPWAEFDACSPLAEIVDGWRTG